jgi:hypothetical protein
MELPLELGERPDTLHGFHTNQSIGSTTMRYAIFGALILSLELFGVSAASAGTPASGNAIVEAGSSRDVIQVMEGCGAKYKRNHRTGQCEPF